MGTALAVEALGTIAKALELVEVICASAANQVFSHETNTENTVCYIPSMVVLPVDFCFAGCFFLGTPVASVAVDG